MTGGRRQLKGAELIKRVHVGVVLAGPAAPSSEWYVALIRDYCV